MHLFPFVYSLVSIIIIIITNILSLVNRQSLPDLVFWVTSDFCFVFLSLSSVYTCVCSIWVQEMYNETLHIEAHKQPPFMIK